MQLVFKMLAMVAKEDGWKEDEEGEEEEAEERGGGRTI
jgi:hypothetical protein